MKIELTKGELSQWVDEQYVHMYLEKGWATVSNTSPKKISKNVIKASADVIEAQPQSNPPVITIKGE